MCTFNHTPTFSSLCIKHQRRNDKCKMISSTSSSSPILQETLVPTILKLLQVRQHTLEVHPLVVRHQIQGHRRLTQVVHLLQQATSILALHQLQLLQQAPLTKQVAYNASHARALTQSRHKTFECPTRRTMNVNADGGYDSTSEHE